MLKLNNVNLKLWNIYLENLMDIHSSQYEALARYSVSREVLRSVLKSEKLLGTLDATPKVPRHTSLT